MGLTFVYGTHYIESAPFILIKHLIAGLHLIFPA